MNFQWYDIPIILVVVLLFFGPKKLPELARGLGSAINEFKSALSGTNPAVTPPAEVKKIETSEEKKDSDKPVG